VTGAAGGAPGPAGRRMAAAWSRCGSSLSRPSSGAGGPGLFIGVGAGAAVCHQARQLPRWSAAKQAWRGSPGAPPGGGAAARGPRA